MVSWIPQITTATGSQWTAMTADSKSLDSSTARPQHYPLVMTNIAIENDHRNSGFSHWTWWFSIVFCMFTRGQFNSSYDSYDSRTWPPSHPHLSSGRSAGGQEAHSVSVLEGNATWTGSATEAMAIRGPLSNSWLAHTVMKHGGCPWLWYSFTGYRGYLCLTMIFTTNIYGNGGEAPSWSLQVVA